MGGTSVDWFDLPVDVLVIGTTRLAIGDRTADLDLLERALDRLSLADRRLLALHHFEHLSLGDIGARVGARQDREIAALQCTWLARACADLRDDFRQSGSVRARGARINRLRRGRETYQTAALPLSYVGADQEPMLKDVSHSRSRETLEIVLKTLRTTLEQLMSVRATKRLHRPRGTVVRSEGLDTLSRRAYISSIDISTIVRIGA